MHFVSCTAIYDTHNFKNLTEIHETVYNELDKLQEN